MKNIFLTADPILSKNLDTRQLPQHQPCVNGNIITTTSNATMIFIFELIPTQGKYEFSFCIKKIESFFSLFIGLSNEGEFNKLDNQPDDSILFHVGTGGIKYLEDIYGNTKWDYTKGGVKQFKAPLLISFQIDRSKNSLVLLYNRKIAYTIPMTNKMKICKLQPRINVIVKDTVIQLNCSHCRTCGNIMSKLLMCGKCLKVKYCGVDCQKIDWKDHKLVCNI